MASLPGGPDPAPARHPLFRFQDEELIGAGFGTPDFAPAACELPHPGVAIGERKGLEFLCVGIEAQDRIRAPVADPDRVGLVHIDCVGLRPVAWQAPARGAKHHANSDHGEAPTDGGPGVAVYEYALAIAGSATPRRPVPMNSTISAAAIHKRPASMKASR